tara:strand:+ start:6429 stop:6734 length:306 start_codon:yes stop_codon:yes gene_type:complete
MSKHREKYNDDKRNERFYQSRYRISDEDIQRFEEGMIENKIDNAKSSSAASCLSVLFLLIAFFLGTFSPIFKVEIFGFFICIALIFALIGRFSNTSNHHLH